MYKVTSIHGSADVYVEGPDGQIFANAGIVKLCSTQEEAEAVTKANVENARRIATCLNACAGLDTKIVQTIAAFGGMCQDNAVKAITVERDQLVDALDKLLRTSWLETSLSMEKFENLVSVRIARKLLDIHNSAA